MIDVTNDLVKVKVSEENAKDELYSDTMEQIKTGDEAWKLIVEDADNGGVLALYYKNRKNASLENFLSE